MINLNSVLLKIPYSLFGWFHNKKRERIHHSCPPPPRFIEKRIFLVHVCVCVCVFISWSTSNMDSCILLCTRACSYTPLYTPDCDRLHLLRHRSCFYACDTPCVDEKKRIREDERLKKMRVRDIFNLSRKSGKKMKSPLRLPVIFLDFFISRGFKDVGPFVVFFVVAFAFWIGRHGELKWCLEFV